MADTFTVDVERHGRVELVGPGPFAVREYGRGSYEIINNDRQPAKPKVWRTTGGANTVEKPHQNTVWAFKSVPNVIVEAANAAWEAQHG